MFRKTLLTITATLLLGFCFTGQSSEVKPLSPKTFTFNVEVSCMINQTLKNEIESYIKRELRALGDVKIVSKNDYSQYHLRLEVLYLNIETVAISYVLTESIFRMAFLRPYLSKKQITDIQHKIADTEGMFRHNDIVFIDSKLISYYPSWQKLPDICKKIVIDYDVNLLEPIRESRQ